MALDFVTVDVFTDRKFGGNPLAVVLDAGELTTEQMQSIAAEFNLAETTFVRPAKQRGHTAEVRIFTPRFEMPFAGHPNVGTAFVLASTGLAAEEPLVFEEIAGLVHVDIIRDGTSVAGARIAAPQSLQRSDDVAPAIVAKASSLGSKDIETAHHQPCIISCGAKFVAAELKTRTSLAAARPRPDVFAEHLDPARATGLLLYTFDQPGNADIQARMFAPLYGVPEDPATGSANIALVGLLATLRPDADLALNVRISQGVDMGRPSLLDATAEKKGGRVAGMWIGGGCVEMMRGHLDL